MFTVTDTCNEGKLLFKIFKHLKFVLIDDNKQIVTEIVLTTTFRDVCAKPYLE